MAIRTYFGLVLSLFLASGVPVFQCGDIDLTAGYVFMASGEWKSISLAHDVNFLKGIQSFAVLLTNESISTLGNIEIAVESTFGYNSPQPLNYSFKLSRKDVSSSGFKNQLVPYFERHCAKPDELNFNKRTHNEVFGINKGGLYTFDVSLRGTMRNVMPSYAFHLGSQTRSNVDLFGVNRTCQGPALVRTEKLIVSAETGFFTPMLFSFEKYNSYFFAKWASAGYHPCPEKCLPALITRSESNLYVPKDEFDCRPTFMWKTQDNDEMIRQKHIWWHPDCPSTIAATFRQDLLTRHYIITLESEMFPSNEIDCPVATTGSKPSWYMYQGFDKGYSRLFPGVIFGKTLLFKMPPLQNDANSDDNEAIMQRTVVLKCNDSAGINKHNHEVAIASATKSLIECKIDNLVGDVYLGKITIIPISCKLVPYRFWPIIFDRRMEFDVKAEYSVTPSVPSMSDFVRLGLSAVTFERNVSSVYLKGNLTINPATVNTVKGFRCDDVVHATCEPPQIIAKLEFFLRSKGGYNGVPVVQFRHLYNLKVNILPHSQFRPNGKNQCLLETQRGDCYPLDDNVCRPIGSALEWFNCLPLGGLLNYDETMIIPSNFGFSEPIVVPCLAGWGHLLEWERYNRISKAYEKMPGGTAVYGHYTNEELKRRYGFAQVHWTEAVSQTFRCQYRSPELGKVRISSVNIFNTADYIKICSFDLAANSDRYNARAVVMCSLTREGTQLFMILRDNTGEMPIDLSEYEFDPPFVVNPNVTTSSAVYEYNQILEMNISIDVRKVQWQPKVFEATGMFSLMLYLDEDILVRPVEPFHVNLVYARATKLSGFIFPFLFSFANL